MLKILPRQRFIGLLIVNDLCRKLLESVDFDDCTRTDLYYELLVKLMVLNIGKIFDTGFDEVCEIAYISLTFGVNLEGQRL